MAGSVNKAVLVGHVGKAPEVRAMQDGSKIVSFSLATNEAWTDRTTGQRQASAAAVALLGATTVHAGSAKLWLDSPGWQVVQHPTDIGQICLARHSEPVAHGFVSIGLSELDTLNAAALHVFADDGFVAHSPITIRIDNGTPQTARNVSATDGDTATVMLHDLGEIPRVFWGRLAAARVLRVTISASEIEFSLAGAAGAMAALEACVAHIAMEHGGAVR